MDACILQYKQSLATNKTPLTLIKTLPARVRTFLLQ